MALKEKSPVGAGPEIGLHKDNDIPLFAEKEGFKHVLLEIKYNVFLFAVFNSENFHFQVFKKRPGEGYPSGSAFSGPGRRAWSFVDMDEAYHKFFSLIELIEKEARHE